MQEARVRKLLKPTNDSWRLDEMWVKIKGNNHYLYRAIDSNDNTIEFLLCKRRNKKAVKRFLKKALGNKSIKKPRVIKTDKDKAIKAAIKKMHIIHKIQVKNYFRDYRNEQDLLNKLFGIDKTDSTCEWKMAA